MWRQTTKVIRPAEIMAWEEDHVEKIIRRYGDRSAATKALIRQLNETELAKTADKTTSPKII